MINKSAADCSISLTFCTVFDHVIPDQKQTLKSTGQRSRSERKNASDRQVIAHF